MTSIAKQESSHHTVKVYLENLREEKKQMVKDGLLKKQSGIIPITEREMPYELPEEWEWVRLGEITTKIHYGYTASATDRNTGVKMLRITDIQDEKVEWSKVPYCEISESKLETSKLFPNDILIARTGGTVGKSFLVENVEGNSVFASYLIRVQLMKQVNAEYIKFFFSSSLYWNQLTNAVTGTGQPNVNARALSHLIIPLPNLSEQERIIKQLKKARSLKENLYNIKSSSQKEIKNYYQAILEKAVHGDLVRQDISHEPAIELLKRIEIEKKRMTEEREIRLSKSNPIKSEEKFYDLPTGWEWARLGDIVQFIDYRGKTPIKTDEGIPLITAKNIKMGFVSENPREFIDSGAYNTWMTRGIPRLGDLLFTTEAPLGNIAAITFEHKFALAQRAICFKRYTDDINTSILLRFIMSPFMQNQISNMATGTTVKGIKAAKLKEALIPIPPLVEQEYIIEKLDSITFLCNRLENELNKTEEQVEKWYQAMLKETFHPNVE